MKNKGIMVVVSGFSGAGKGTIMKELIKKYDYSLSISATTRKPRPGEVDGQDYFFLTKDKFQKMISEDGFIEHAKYVDNYYGTPASYVEEQLLAGHDVLLEIEMQGCMQVKEKYPDSVLVFITPPSAKVLRDRLVGRGTEDSSTIDKRLSRASEEAEYMGKYDYIIVNDVLDIAVENIHNVIETEHEHVNRQGELIHRMTEELKAFQKGIE